MHDKDFHTRTTIPDFSIEKKTPLMPEKIGPYKIESLLSKGTMSFLYFSHHLEENIPLVIKVLSPEFIEHKELTAHFLKEAEIIKMNSHPNIVKYYRQGKWEGGLYIAMEFIQGISLKQFIQTKAFSQKKALEIVLQIASALHHLHSYGVIHRDIKPENIIITESGDIKLIDFGVAQLEGTTSKNLIFNQSPGTPNYMSPEQKKSPEDICFASDIFSLGVIAYELISGKLSKKKIHLNELNPTIATVLQKSLHENLDERYHDISDFIKDISNSMKTLESHSFIKDIKSVHYLIAEAPFWPNVDIGIAVQDKGSFSIYIDFFMLNHGCLGVILAEPKNPDCMHAANIRGMTRMVMSEVDLKHTHPLKILKSLNLAVCKDSKQENYCFSFLFLDPEADTLSFISLGYHTLCYLPEKILKPRILITPNHPLGERNDANFLQTINQWDSGDTLILHSNSSYDKTLGEKEHFFKSISFHDDSVKNKTQKILDHLAAPEQNMVVLSLERIF